MGLFSKMGEMLGLVEDVDIDDEEDYGFGEMPQNNSSFTNQTSSFGGFNTTEPTQAKPERSPFDINVGRQYKPGTKVTNYTGDQIKMIVINPDNYDEAREICDYIKSGKPVVVNLENMAFETAQRVMDFLSGSCYSLNGNIQRVAKNIFIVAPNNIDVSADMNRASAAKANALPSWMQQQAKPGMNDFDYRGNNQNYEYLHNNFLS